ncbi:hypothetical protein [Filomicrobium sp.]|uniref:hypothetical protein n=1 Tax=Filomicrobium sp. TaxID=2024831 RepID=UPI00258CA5D9|nr:hypothetical protein [Filomicrobium sp.]MCV0371734.1 hypothetical protein [Filomicrobium sp.]
MKRDAIRAEVKSALDELGFREDQCRWAGCSLHISVAGDIKTMRFPAGMTMRQLMFEIGRLTGWVEMAAQLGTAVVASPKRRANGHAAEHIGAM